MYIACGSASLYIKTLYFFLSVLALSAAATVANIEICYDAKIPQFAIHASYMCSTVIGGPKCLVSRISGPFFFGLVEPRVRRGPSSKP